jgi:hypothetical protein
MAGELGGTNPKFSCFCQGGFIVLSIDSVREQQLSLALRSVDLNRKGNCGTDENALGSFFRDH